MSLHNSEIRHPLGARFWRVWTGQTLSAIGSVLSAVGVAVFVYLETNSAIWLGALTALAAIPFVLVSPFLGVVDRYSRRTVMMAADTFAVIGPAIALVLAFTDQLEVWHLAVAGFLSGVGTAVQLPAAHAAIPALVSRDALGRANGMSQLGPSLGAVAGPVLATPLVAWWGIKVVLIVDIITFIIAITLTLLTRFADHVDEQPVADDGTWSAAIAWLRTAGRPLLVLLVSMAIVNFCFAFYNVSVLAIATDVGGASRAGIALGVGGLSMVVGSLTIGRRGIPTSRVRTFVVGLALMSIGCVVLAIRPIFGLVIVGSAISLFWIPAANAAISTIFHEQVPASMQGRIFGLRVAMGRALEPVGAILTGLVIAAIAEPALRPNGALSGSLGRIIGTGEGRGAAAVLIAVAMALTLVAVWISSNRSIAQLDRAADENDDAATEPSVAGHQIVA